MKYTGVSEGAEAFFFAGLCVVYVHYHADPTQYIASSPRAPDEGKTDASS